MKKVFKIEIDCAGCAAKVQDKVSKVDGVNSVSINFMSQKMIIDIDDSRFADVMKEVEKTAKKVEPDFEILG